MQMLYDSDTFVVLHMQPDLGQPEKILLSDGKTETPRCHAMALRLSISARAKRCTWMASGRSCSSARFALGKLNPLLRKR